MRVLVCLDVLVMNPDYSVNEVSAKKIRTWREAGADVEFITKLNKFLDLKKIDDVLKDSGLEGVKVHKKMEGDKFQPVIEGIKPHLFIDCQGTLEEGISISEKFKPDYKLKRVLLESIEEIALLPDLPDELKDYAKEKAEAVSAE